MSPLEAAKEAIRLRSLYDNNWHPMGGHGDPVRGPGFDLDRHIRNHAVAIATALIEAEEKVGRMREALKSLRRKHFDNEMDTYYSCPKTEDWNGCNDPKMEALPPEERECRCGADSANAIIDAALAGDPK